MKLMRTAELEI